MTEEEQTDEAQTDEAPSDEIRAMNDGYGLENTSK